MGSGNVELGRQSKVCLYNIGSHIAKTGGCGRHFPDQGTADIFCRKCGSPLQGREGPLRPQMFGGTITGVGRDHERSQNMIAKVNEVVERTFDRLEARFGRFVPAVNRSDDDGEPPSPSKH